MTSTAPELYASAHFTLELEGISTATVKSIDGGHPKAEVITYHSNAQQGAQYRQSGKRKYEDLKIVLGLVANGELWNWMNTFLEGECERKHGAVIAADYEYNEKARRTFKEAIIAGIDFPKFDAKDKNPATITLTLSPETIAYEAATGNALNNNDASAQQHVKACNFEFTFDKLPPEVTNRVVKVDGFSVKTKVIEHHYAGSPHPLKIAGKMEWPTIAFYVPEPDAEPFIKLMTGIMGGDQNEQQSAGLTFFDNKKTPKGTFKFEGCTLMSAAAEKHDASNEEVRLVKVEMQVEKVSFKSNE